MKVPSTSILSILVAFTATLITADDNPDACGCPSNQAEGTCTFYLSAVQGPGADGTFGCGVFDHNCNQIMNAADICDPGIQLTGSLPNTVLVRSRDQSVKLEATISYQGTEYKTSQIKDCSQGLVARSEAYATFPCPGF